MPKFSYSELSAQRRHENHCSESAADGSCDVMKVEVYEQLGNGLECRIYEIQDDLARVLIDKSRGMGEVWGFDSNGKQHEASKLIDVIKNVILLA